MYCVYGATVILLTDNGTQFVSKLFQTVCRLSGVKQGFTTAYHPQTNGQCERFNRTILSAMSHYISDNQDNWDELSYTATYAYNMTVHSSTGDAPFELTLSRSTSSHIVKDDLEYGIQSSDIKKSLYRNS
jgi:transposase InsO family protein